MLWGNRVAQKCFFSLFVFIVVSLSGCGPDDESETSERDQGSSQKEIIHLEGETFEYYPGGSQQETIHLEGQTFQRHRGRPQKRTIHFSVDNPKLPHLIHIMNGGRDDQFHRVTSAHIWLNGEIIADPGDFGRRVKDLEIPVTVQKDNQLDIAIRGRPGSGFELNIHVLRPENPAPEITSEPTTSATVGVSYSYQVTADDPAGGDELAYALEIAPNGMSIGADSGLVAWEPGDGDVGTHPVTIEVTNDGGASATQSYELEVVDANRPPTITSTPITTVTALTDYTYQVTAEDADDGDELSYSLETAPEGMVVGAQSGLIEWSPVGGDTGLHSVVVTATDLDGASDTQSFELDVTRATADAYIELASEVLENDDIPPTTPEEFAESEFAQHQADAAIRARNARDHALVMSAVDPDPDWHATELDRRVIITAPGQSHVLNVRKLDPTLHDIGPAGPQRLRLEIRIQRGDNEFERVPEAFGGDIARWLNDGELEVTVPNDLGRGRLIIGLRPDFFDPGQRAIAERWSTAAMFEVWPTNPGVRHLNSSEVLFPQDGDPVRDPEALFSSDELGEALVDGLNNEEFLLPLVLQTGEPVVVGDLVDYRLDERPYGGRVASVTERDNQQLVLIAPEWINVYDIADADDRFLVEQGVLPENIIYRTGPAIEGFDADYRSDLLTLDSDEDTEEIQTLSQPAFVSSQSWLDVFERACEGSVTAASLTFDATAQLYPFEAGIEMGIGIADNAAINCVWSANPNGKRVDLLRIGGPLAILIKALTGAEAEVGPFGKISFKSEIDGPLVPGLRGVSFGVNTREGVSVDMGFAPEFVRYDDLQNGAAVKYLASLGASTGAKGDFNLVSASGLIGWLLERLGVDDAEIGVETTLGIGIGGQLQGASAPSVYRNGDTSQAAMAVDFHAKLDASGTVVSLARALGVDLEPGLSFSVKQDVLKLGGQFEANSVNDDGRGNAYVQDLVALPMLASLFNLTPYGVLGPENEASSVFNDKHDAIQYDQDECADSPDSKISAPVIACAALFCGRTAPIRLCGGELWIDKIDGHGIVDEQVTASSQLGITGAAAGGAEPRIFSVSGSPMLTDSFENEFELAPGDTRTYQAEAECTTPGMHEGTIRVSAIDGSAEAESSNILTCRCEPDSPDCDRTWGSPHLVTADGLAYDYYASGDYILQRVPDVPGLEVQARFLSGMDVSWPQAVAMRVGRDVVEIHGSRMDDAVAQSHLLEVYVNGRALFPRHRWHPVEQTRHIRLPNGGNIFIDQFMRRYNGQDIDPIAITVTWPQDGAFTGYGASVTGMAFDQTEKFKYEDLPPIIDISLHRAETYAGQERGMLGTNDDDPGTDMTRRNGQVIEFHENLSWTELYVLFGADWLAQPGECLFRNGCIEPDFPNDPLTLEPQELAYAQTACASLSGWYYEACVHDVGIVGSEHLVQGLYANTEDLNEMADQVVQPGTDRPLYVIEMGKPYKAGFVDRYPVRVSHVEGEGEYQINIRPPRGMTATLMSTGGGSRRGSGDWEGILEVSCLSDPVWGEMEGEQPVHGALQLFGVNALSGATIHLLGEVPISQNRLKDRCVDIASELNRSVEGEAILYITSDMEDRALLSISPREGIILNEEVPEHIDLCSGCETRIETGHNCDAGYTKVLDLGIYDGGGDLHETRTLGCFGLSTLNDTGISVCSDGSRISPDCPVNTHPGQDGDLGRDARDGDGDLPKIGAGDAGFDYTKIGADGAELSDSSPDWPCVRDNQTGLIWEVKRSDSGLQNWRNTYTWYEPEVPTIGSAGVQDGGSCTGSACDTSSYADAINSQGLCGSTDWRLPTVSELQSLLHYGMIDPAIDANYFPNTKSYGYWTASSAARSGIWMVDFDDATSKGQISKSSQINVRLVRDDQ